MAEHFSFLLLEGSSSTYMGAPRVNILGGSGFPAFMVHSSAFMVLL